MAAVDIDILQKKVALNRDPVAYKELYYYFYSDLNSFAISFVKQKELAEEIVSDVMIKIWTMEADLMRINNLRVYLFVAIKNTSLTALSKNKLLFSEIEELPEISVDWLDPERVVISKELNNLIEDSIQKLPSKCRMAYLLVRRYGYRYKETGVIMNISENTVDRHLQMAVKHLSAMLKKHL